MKVTRDMLHPDLQPLHGSLRVMTAMLKRRWFLRSFDRLNGALSKGRGIEGLACETHHADSSDGRYRIRTRVYRPEGVNEQLPALIYLHGGGYLFGFPEMFHDVIERFIETRPCVVIAPDYRKAWTEPFPAGFDDCYATLLWAKANATSLGIRDDAVVVAGHSAGGGLTAAVTLKARDTGDVNVAFQMPIYPMIDDTQPDDPDRAIDSLIWNTELNRVGWGAYLAGLRRDGAEIPAYAAPARNADYTNFPPTITLVGTLEPFHQETLAYVRALRDAGVEVAFEEYENCFHAFDMLGTPVSEAALDFTFDSFATFYDRSFGDR